MTAGSRADASIRAGTPAIAPEFPGGGCWARGLPGRSTPGSLGGDDGLAAELDAQGRGGVCLQHGAGAVTEHDIVARDVPAGLVASAAARIVVDELLRAA